MTFQLTSTQAAMATWTTLVTHKGDKFFTKALQATRKATSSHSPERDLVFMLIEVSLDTVDATTIQGRNGRKKND